MSREIRWGILGTASIARKLVRAIGHSANACVQGVASREWTRAGEFAKEYGIPRAFGAYDDLLRSGEIDAVYNPLPNSMHAEWTIRALEAGLPVLCEKPLAVDAAEARQMVDASRRAGKLLAEAFMYRYHPVYDQLFDLYAQGAIGELVMIRSAFSFFLTDRSEIPASAELAGGALMDIGCYCVNFSRWLAGCEPARVHAFERRTTVDDTFLGQLEFPNGVLAQFECSLENPERIHAELIGTKGRILLENPWCPGEEAGHLILVRGDVEERITTDGANCYRLEIEDFGAALLNGIDVRWPVDDAVANMAVIDALYASAREGTVVSVGKR